MVCVCNLSAGPVIHLCSVTWNKTFTSFSVKTWSLQIIVNHWVQPPVFYLFCVIDSQPNSLRWTYFLGCCSPTQNRTAHLNRKVANTVYIDATKHMLVTTATDDVHHVTHLATNYPWFLNDTGYPLSWL